MQASNDHALRQPCFLTHRFRATTLDIPTRPRPSVMISEVVGGQYGHTQECARDLKLNRR